MVCGMFSVMLRAFDHPSLNITELHKRFHSNVDAFEQVLTFPEFSVQMELFQKTRVYSRLTVIYMDFFNDDEPTSLSIFICNFLPQ